MTDPARPRSIADGRIELVEEIGRGGSGAVWRATDHRSGRSVAVKFLKEVGADADSGRRLEREARVMARLDHPGIVSVHDIVMDDGLPFLVMELVDGRPLSELLPLAPTRALAITIRIAEAVAHAHEQGIVHRDLKPANVLVATDGQVKVADFGIARLHGPSAAFEPKLTATGIVVGTPRFLSPEALDGAPPDPRMDIYSLGALLREMIQPLRPGTARSMLPSAIGKIVARAMALDPAARYGSANEMLDDLWRAAEVAAERARKAE